jgi:hypothetical protein
LDATARQELLARYRDGYRVLLDAIAGITDAELDARATPDAWTVREVVHHLADAEMTNALRLRRLIAEEHPVIVGYDEKAYTQRLHYDRPIEPSLLTVRAVRESTTSILESLTEAEWNRAGTHTELGRYTVDLWLRRSAAHGHDHAEQIRQARGR